MIKSTSLYYQEKRIVIHSQSPTKDGFWIAHEPYILLSRDVHVEQIVEGVKKCLLTSKKQVKMPTNWPQFEQNYLSSLRIKSFHELKTVTTKYCHINLQNDRIVFVPSKRDPTSDAGFIHKPAEVVNILFSANNYEVYSALKIALDKCD